MSDNKDLSIEELAVSTLRGVCDDSDAPAAAKGAAARTLLEYAGAIGRFSEGRGDLATKSLSEMSAAELDAEIMRLTK
jgi:hypothetical protein